MEKMGLTLKEASEITGIGYQQLHCWAEERPDFPAFKIGRKMIIPTQQLREYMGRWRPPVKACRRGRQSWRQFEKGGDKEHE